MKSAGIYGKLSTAVSPGARVKGDVKRAWLHVMHLKENQMGTKRDHVASFCCYRGLCHFVFSIMKTERVHGEGEKEKPTQTCIKDSYAPFPPS